MIFLTGDVHFKNKRLFTEQKFMAITEVEASNKYIQIVHKYGIKATLFFTGKSFEEEADVIRDILKFKNLEIGGHTYNAYQPEILYRLFRRFTDSANGPEWWQERDIKKTLRAIKNVTGETVVSWRNHAYRYDRYTYNILKKYGIRVVSNNVTTKKRFPEKINDTILSLPINVMPDHEHLYHGEKKYRKGVKESFGKYSQGIFYFIDKWFEIIKGEIESIEKENGCATILAHPSCMEISDEMETFDKLCSFLSQYKTAFVREAIISNEQ
ncbi:MAG: polysaccharide deacetylase family protein [Nitrospinae bacterium]|nr:polysaccharide deacetylase family protein [Nitrospinota bacterium]